jgi:MFS family permease
MHDGSSSHDYRAHVAALWRLSIAGVRTWCSAAKPVRKSHYRREGHYFPRRGSRPWAAWPGFTVFAGFFILARLFLGHLADRFVAPRVALLSVLVKAAGLALLALSPSFVAALAGAALAGFGYSLVYPALGVDAVRIVPPQNRGLAMGAYTGFLDVALGFGMPALGFLAEGAGLGGALVASMLAALGAAGIAGFLLRGLREQRLVA